MSCIIFTKLFLCWSCIATFCAFSCPYLALNVSPAIPVADGLIFFFVMATLLRTTFSDPGMIPRATPDEAADIERQIGAYTYYLT